MKRLIRRYMREDDAAVAFEAVIITPILAWLFVGSFVFFDAFRTYNTSLKATYAVADVLSRETDWIYGSDIEGLADVFQHITRNVEQSSLRVTQVRRSTSEYRIDWSYATDGTARLFDSNIPAIQSQLPNMVFGERIIVVETFLPYRPAFNVGLRPLEFTNFTVTRPRFAGQLQFDDGSDPLYCGSSCNFGDGDEEPDPDTDSGPAGS
ncbi:TadE/TadG family type IV pilus assembly protein [Rhodophyticola sp.]|uniref:TadE/TadG family type IV pilus assembly protein n=1 Tax=Rhodophyticola sp. TaxID=2680032 RepID=UPI003D29966A